MSRRIFITGGASGLGLALALRCSRAGWRVCIGDCNEERGRVSGLDFVSCDVRQERDLEAARDHLAALWGGVDVVVNNAGICGAGNFEKMALEEWSRILDVNLLGVVRGCKVFTPVFQGQGQGHFVNMASVAGLFEPPLMTAYNVSKAGVIKLSETLAVELHPHNIQVSVVCPFFVKTNLCESLGPCDEELQQSVTRVFEHAYLTADQVAESIFQCLQKPRFYVVPHRRERLFWYLKGLLPHGLYVRIFRKLAATFL